MTLSWSETSTEPVKAQQSAYSLMSLSIFAALSGVSREYARGICQGRVRRTARRINCFMGIPFGEGGFAPWSRGGLYIPNDGSASPDRERRANGGAPASKKRVPGV